MNLDQNLVQAQFKRRALNPIKLIHNIQMLKIFWLMIEFIQQPLPRRRRILPVVLLHLREQHMRFDRREDVGVEFPPQENHVFGFRQFLEMVDDESDGRDGRGPLASVSVAQLVLNQHREMNFGLLPFAQHKLYPSFLARNGIEKEGTFFGLARHRPERRQRYHGANGVCRAALKVKTCSKRVIRF